MARIDVMPSRAVNPCVWSRQVMNQGYISLSFCPEYTMTEQREFKPNKTPFVYYPVLIQLGLLLVVLVCVYLASALVSFPLGEVMGAVFGLGVLSAAWTLFVRLRVFAEPHLLFFLIASLPKVGGDCGI